MDKKAKVCGNCGYFAAGRCFRPNGKKGGLKPDEEACVLLVWKPGCGPDPEPGEEYDTLSLREALGTWD
jgi:hypothetical protein